MAAGQERFSTHQRQSPAPKNTQTSFQILNTQFISATKMDLRVQSLFGQLSLLSLELPQSLQTLPTSCTCCSNSDSNKSTETLGQHSCRGTKPDAAAENSIFPTHISCSWASHQPGRAADLSGLCSAQKKCQRAKRKTR